MRVGQQSIGGRWLEGSRPFVTCSLAEQSAWWVQALVDMAGTRTANVERGRGTAHLVGMGAARELLVPSAAEARTQSLCVDRLWRGER